MKKKNTLIISSVYLYQGRTDILGYGQLTVNVTANKKEKSL